MLHRTIKVNSNRRFMTGMVIYILHRGRQDSGEPLAVRATHDSRKDYHGSMKQI